eukprot:752434-Hanusia_phi.AAC.3
MQSGQRMRQVQFDEEEDQYDFQERGAKEAWLVTSQRAAHAKPTDEVPLDDLHHLRKTTVAIQSAKMRIDREEPRTVSRWRGRNFFTIARRHAEREGLSTAKQNLKIAKKRAETSFTLTERKKNAQDHVAHPSLLQRRLGRSASKEIQEWKPREGQVGLTIREIHDTSTWSLKPPWVKRISQDKLLRRGAVRPEKMNVPAMKYGSQDISKVERGIDCLTANSPPPPLSSLLFSLSSLPLPLPLLSLALDRCLGLNSTFNAALGSTPLLEECCWE